MNCQRAIKRAIDVTVASLAIVVLSPVMLFLAAAIWLRLGWPVLFCQRRPGLHGRPFWLVKFRTMRDARDRQGRRLPDAERLTRLGRILRSTSLDELPELLNVLRGEMSLVGPRPLLMEYLDRYTPRQARRHEVKPGMTGWAQVHGRNAIGWHRRLALDAWYARHWSVLLDCRILLLTVVAVLGRRGVRAPGHATMPEFMGSRPKARSRPTSHAGV